MREKKIKCLVVDDEPIGREIVEGYVRETPNLELTASCKNAFEALDILQHQAVDLLFSDIQMPKVNGLELVKSLPHQPVIIFITGYPDFAVDSYELNITDYLLKPVSYERFLKAVNKAVAKIEAEQKTAMPAAANKDTVFFKADGKYIKVVTNEIRYVESCKDYVKIYADKEPLLIRSTMTAIEDELPADKFFRIHKTCIVALCYIKSVFGNTVELLNDTSLPVAQERKKELYELLNIHEK